MFEHLACNEIINPPFGSNYLNFESERATSPGGGHWSRKGVWGCAALKTPFSRLSCHLQGSHFKRKSQFTRPPFGKIWKFKPLQPQFSPNFSSQAPKFGNFQLTSPQIWKFSAHKPPFSEANYVSSQAPHLGNPGRTPLPEKKLSAPPRLRHIDNSNKSQWFRKHTFVA